LGKSLVIAPPFTVALAPPGNGRDADGAM